MSTAKVNFALMGCGRIASKHAEAVGKQIEEAALVAVCDIDTKRAAEFGKKYGVPYFSDVHEMMRERPEIHVVNVLTPSGDHAEHVIELAKYGKHIVVEKPMALTLVDAERMVRACSDHGVRLFVVKQNRMNPPVAKLKEAVLAGRFGKMVMATTRVRWCRTQKYYDQDAWRGTWAKDGGVLMNQASHHVDLLTWLMGDVESVFAYSATRLVDVETEDTAVAVLKFTNGALGIVEATTATRPLDLEGSVSILGERGTVEIGGFAANEMKIWNFVDATDQERTEVRALSTQPANVYGHGHTPYLRNVVAAIRQGRGGAVDGLEGMKSLILINAFYESMETGREVRLQFKPRHVRLGKPPHVP